MSLRCWGPIVKTAVWSKAIVLFSQILIGATVCYKCGRHQSNVWSIINRWVPLISLAGVILLGFQVIIAYQQIIVAREQAIEARAKRQMLSQLSQQRPLVSNTTIINKLLALSCKKNSEDLHSSYLFNPT